MSNMVYMRPVRGIRAMSFCPGMRVSFGGRAYVIVRVDDSVVELRSAFPWTSVAEVCAAIVGCAAALALVIVLAGCGGFGQAIINAATPGYNEELIYEQGFGYYGLDGDTFMRYRLEQSPKSSPGGVKYQGNVSEALLDDVVGKTLSCLGAQTRKSEFVVIVADDWIPSYDGMVEDLPVRALAAGCQDKGQVITAAHPCHWRSGIRGPNGIVTTPSLYLAPDALARWLRGAKYVSAHGYNLWADPETVKCLGPFSPAWRGGTK